MESKKRKEEEDQEERENEKKRENKKRKISKINTFKGIEDFLKSLIRYYHGKQNDKQDGKQDDKQDGKQIDIKSRGIKDRSREDKSAKISSVQVLKYIVFEQIKVDMLTMAINQLNLLNTEIQEKLIVCNECNRLCRNANINWLSTTKYGEEKPFCLDCTYFCKLCQEEFCEQMEYEHECCGNTDNTDNTDSSDN